MCDNQTVCCVVKTVKKNAEEEFVGARVKQLSGTKVFQVFQVLCYVDGDGQLFEL